MANRMIVVAVLASVVALAAAVVALVRQMHQTRALAIKATARLEPGDGGRRLVIEVINTAAATVTLQAIGLWVSVDKRRGAPATPGQRRDWEDLWDHAGSMLELANPSLPTELDGGIWQAWGVELEPGHPIELPGARAYVTVYLKPGGTTTALVQR